MFKMKKLLLPFSWLYGLITDIRNYLYDTGFWKSKFFKIPIINVGNITVGGTGKTPMVEYLIRLLKDKYQIVTLSRGYGRKTKGFILADDTANAESIGDEPMQFYQKFGNEINVTVGEKRVKAIEQILQQKTDTEIVILDDAFQHRAVKPSLSILLIDYNRPIDEDYPFPAGRLRERRHGAKRADLVVITKCPDDLNLEAQSSLKNRLKPYLKENNTPSFRGWCPHQTPVRKQQSTLLSHFWLVRTPATGRKQESTPILFTKILYGKPINCRSDSRVLNEKESILLISGIAKPEPFENYVRQKFKIVSQLVFKDHHLYSEEDIKFIISKMPTTAKVILMTEKDMVKFKPFLNHELLKDIPLFYLPIEVGFINENENLEYNIAQKY